MRIEAALVAVAVVAGRSTPLCQATRAGRQSSSARMRIVGRDEWLLISREAVGLAQQRAGGVCNGRDGLCLVTGAPRRLMRDRRILH